MVWFIIGLILLVGASVALVVAINAKRDGEDEYFGLFSKIAGGVALVGLILASFSTIYTQDEGEANVIKSISGEVVSTDTTPGWGMKSPWSKVLTYSTRNNSVEMDMPFNDKQGARGTLTLQVIYNLNASEETLRKIYSEYKSENELKDRLITQNTRSVVNAVPNKYTTTQIKTERGKLEMEIQAELVDRLEQWGFTGLQVNIMDDGYPQEITDRYNALVAELTKAEEAKASTRTAEEKAKQKIVEAEAEAKARKINADSLKDENALRYMELDTLKAVGEKGNLIITDGKANTLLNVDTNKE